MYRPIQLLFAVLLTGGVIQGADTKVLFDTRAPSPFPFPADSVTVADPAQKTGLRINLPLPDCTAEPSTCKEIRLINELDGFSLTPRINVRFSGPIKVDTLRDGIYIIWLDDLTTEESGLQPVGHVTLMNEMLYDPVTNTAYAKPDEFLSQHRRYVLVVTDAIEDAAGVPVTADAAFQTCLSQQTGYCGQLGRAVAQAAPAFSPRRIVAASLFTTLSATAWLEKARDQLENSPIGLQRTGSKNVYKVSEIASISAQFQTTTDPAKLTPRDSPLYLLNGVGRMAFGSILSPQFRNADLGISAIPTGKDVALPATVERLHFHVFLPETPAPSGGYPVVIAPGNAGGSKWWHSVLYASRFTFHGMATIAIDLVGAGWGPEGKLVIQERTGAKYEVPLGGRGSDLNGDKTIATGEGCDVPWTSSAPVGGRDCLRQNALDLHQLVRAIKAGIDVDGDGAADLNPGRIYYHGMSYGANVGPVFAAISPDVAAAVIDGGAGPMMSNHRWNKITGLLAQRTPSLLNKGNTFDEDYVLRYRPVEIIDVPGALAIQECFERVEWLQMPGDPTAYAPHLWSSTLAGVPMKRTLFMYAIGDGSPILPAETALVRAANLRETTSLYRHDLALKLFPKLLAGGHYFSMPFALHFNSLQGTDPLGQYLIAMLAQEQAAGFLASHGTVIPDVNIWSRLWFGVELFETPPKFLPEASSR